MVDTKAAAMAELRVEKRVGKLAVSMVCWMVCWTVCWSVGKMDKQMVEMKDVLMVSELVSTKVEWMAVAMAVMKEENKVAD